MFGCVDSIGPQAGDIARTCWLAAGLPEHVPGTTVDRQCGSSQQAVHFAAQGVMSGTQDLVVAGGVQNMSQIPITLGDDSSAEPFGFTDPFTGSPGWVARYGDAGGHPVPRRRDDRREVGHHPRGDGGVRGRVATSARSGRSAEGRFEREIVAARRAAPSTRARAEPDLEKIRVAAARCVEGGRLTAAVSPARSATARPRC